MPIYAYRCDACGFAKDVLQKMSDEALSICPQCQKASFTKQVTAAGFQLKGSGWYVTDFKNDSKNTASSADNTHAKESESKKEESSTHDASQHASSTVSHTGATTSEATTHHSVA